MAEFWSEKLSVQYLRENLTFDPYSIINGLASAPAYHLILEALLIIWIIKLLFFTKTYKPGKQDLTEKEKDELIDEWEPEPLVPSSFDDRPLGFKREFSGIPGRKITVNGVECINLSTLNFLNIIGNKDVEKAAIDTVKVYGVGACGPRGFYGTVDVHLKLEEKLSQFMKCEEAILYSYGFSTIASAIPAYAKKGDVIFVDEGTSFPIQKGLQASRSNIKYFKHNDAEDLRRLLQAQAVEDMKNPKKAKATRRFIVVEGVYMNHGDVCPLPELIKLKYEFKVRLLVEESISFGTLGETGRGVTEHFKCDVDDVDMICANLENAVGSVGGFCCGRSFVIDHQRLSGLGYCFSASLPPLLATGAITALNIMENSTVKFLELKNKTEYLHNLLQTLDTLTVTSDPISPIQHLVLTQKSANRQTDCQRLDRIVDFCMERRVAVTQARYLEQFETITPTPSIRLSMNVDLSLDDLKMAVNSLRDACKTVL